MRIGVFAHHVCLSAITETFCRSDLVLCSFEMLFHDKHVQYLCVCEVQRQPISLQYPLKETAETQTHSALKFPESEPQTHLMSTYSDQTTNNRNSAVQIKICLYHAEEEVHLIVFTVHV